MTAIEKLLQKIRETLIADVTIKGYVGTRVYAEHPSTIAEPVYPAISMAIIADTPSETPSLKDMSDITLQIDIWLPSQEYTAEDILIIHRTMRSLLHQQPLSDTTLDLKVMQIVESLMGPTMYEQDSDLIHLPIRYAARAL